MADLVLLAQRLNQTALTGTDGALLDLLRETPISPPHGQASGLTVKKAVTALGGSSANAFGKAKMAGPLTMIAFIKFRPVTSNTDGQEGALTFDVKYATELKTAATRNGWVPCWFLPWKSELLVKLTIAADAGAIPSGDPTIDPLPNPRLFFTAAINGCSVFVYGAASAPSVVHAGFETNSANKEMVRDYLGGNSATMWRALLKGVTASEDGLTLVPLNKAKPNLGEVNRYDYIKTLNDDGSEVFGTPLAAQLKTFLDTHKTDKLQAKTVEAFGSVFGLRVGNAWRMTLQRNASIQYRMITQTGGFLGLGKKTVIRGPKVAKPATKGLDAADKKRVTDKHKQLLMDNQFVAAVVLGYKDFFPGDNQAVNHAHNQLMFW